MEAARGALFGFIFSIPLWALIIWAIWMVLK